MANDDTQALEGSKRSAHQVVTELFQLLEAQGQASYIGEAISQLEHSLQTADAAKKSGADDATVCAALLHDVGQFLPDSTTEDMITNGMSVGKASHEAIGAAYLASLGFSSKVCELVGAHVVAKRYLTATEPGYLEALSSTSKASLKHQGGPFTPAEVKEFDEDPLAQAKIGLRRWDDQAKRTDIKASSLESFKSAVENARFSGRDRDLRDALHLFLPLTNSHRKFNRAATSRLLKPLAFACRAQCSLVQTAPAAGLPEQLLNPECGIAHGANSTSQAEEYAHRLPNAINIDCVLPAYVPNPRLVRQRKELELIRQQAYLNDAIAFETQGEWLGQAHDPVSLDGPMALPMPVEIGTDDDFKYHQDVFQFLHMNLDPEEVLAPEGKHIRDELTSALGLQPGTELKWNTPMVEFKRGPTHIGKLLNALEKNTVVTQFLLGNNVISTTGARRIARFIVDHPSRIETWYLAGNHIRAPGFQLLVDAMVNNPRITNVWLKRNPLSPDSVPNLIRLITQTPNLRTLDLENVEIGDEGVARLMGAIAGQDLPLRHLYLNANGIGEKAARKIAGCLGHSQCKIETLYLGSNPIGDAGALPIAEALNSNTSLLRFSMASTGVTSKGVSALCTSLSTHPRIISLDLARSQTTRVHRQRFNHITDIAIPAVVSVIKNPTMRHLALGRTAFSAEGVEEVRVAVEGSNLCEFHVYRKLDLDEGSSCSLTTRRALDANVKRFFPAEESYAKFTTSLAARFLYSPEDVRLIDSVYRTRDKRDAKQVEHFWKEDDPVWTLVDGDV
ncbi:hypothetical protein K438DRAFT_1751460 [Mycena galopus ATCC 62051]|nr:hypothetical protein K438DRAFT_1751460 [Mycena galopus ATCC 62051]